MYWHLDNKNIEYKLSPEDADRYRELIRQARKPPTKLNRKHFLNRDFHSGASFKGYLRVGKNGVISGSVDITDCYNHVSLEINADSKKELERTVKKFETLRNDVEALVTQLNLLLPYVEEMEKLQRKSLD